MDFGSKNTAAVIAGALFVAVAGVVFYSTFEDEPGPAGPSGAAQSAPVAAERIPLPETARELPHVLDLARQLATSWQKDARLVRLYATPIGADGAVDRERSVVQLVFVSPLVTREHEESNGWRFALEKGKYSTTPIWLHPPPKLDGRDPRWCPLDGVVGDSAPERFTLDVHYAERGGEGPVLLAFTREPKRWMVGADPFTCEILDRSRNVTDQERDAATTDASGPLFDARAAAKLVSAAIDASSCRRPGAGRATVQVTFDRAGKATDVEFIAGSVGTTDAGRCLRDALMQVRIPPWQQGDGRTAARFAW